MNNNLAQISNKLHEVCSTDKKDLPRNSQYGELYHNPELLAKCPRCQNLSELVEDGPIRSLYECRKCGIFSKLTKKQSPPDGKPIECRLKNPCKGCDGNQGIITAVDRTTGNPHSYRLDCGDCGRFQRWIGKKEFTCKLGKQGGRDNA